LFSYSLAPIREGYKSLFPQPLSFHIDAKPPVCFQEFLPLRALCLGGKSIFFILLPPLSSLFALFSALVSFVFNRLRPLFPKHPGRGYQDVGEDTSVTRTAPVLTIFALSALSLMTAPAAEAWGCKGHETVAALAEKHLTPQAKQALFALLTANPIDSQLKRYCGQTGQDAFVDSSTWADDERGREPATAPWHFIDIPLGVTQGPAQKFCGAGGCVLQAITDQLAILKDKSAPGAKRAAALRYVIHFVGDLHQPLHGSTNSDRGGNCVPVKYFTRNPHPRNNSYVPNLHHVWDTEIPESQMQGADPSEFADTLDAEFEASFAAWQQGGMQLDAWAWESHDHAVETAYGAFSKSIPVEPDVPVNACTDDNNIGQRMLHKHLVIGQAYRDQAASVVEERLAQAGIRLAMILNDAAKIGL
jgi:hypothetical protein